MRFVDIDPVGIEGCGQPRQGLEGHANTVVSRRLGLESAQAQVGSRLRVGLQLNRRRVRRHVGRAVVLFGERRRPEAGTDRAADRKFRDDVVARGQLADSLAAEVVVVLKPPRQVHEQLLDRLRGQIDIAGVVLARVNAGVGWLEPG